jgi:hypothetical protein
MDKHWSSHRVRRENSSAVPLFYYSDCEPQQDRHLDKIRYLFKISTGLRNFKEGSEKARILFLVA